MSVRAAKDPRVEEARQLQIIHVSGDAFDQARIFHPFHGLADIAFGGSHNFVKAFKR